MALLSDLGMSALVLSSTSASCSSTRQAQAPESVDEDQAPHLKGGEGYHEWMANTKKSGRAIVWESCAMSSCWCSSSSRAFLSGGVLKGPNTSVRRRSVSGLASS